jgi:hypothetical protein
MAVSRAVRTLRLELLDGLDGIGIGIVGDRVGPLIVGQCVDSGGSKESEVPHLDTYHGKYII